MDESGAPFPGLLWVDRDYGLNWIKLQNYDAGQNLAWFDDVVAATERIGCIGGDPGSPDPPDPADPEQGCSCRSSGPQPPMVAMWVVLGLLVWVRRTRC